MQTQRRRNLLWEYLSFSGLGKKKWSNVGRYCAQYSCISLGFYCLLGVYMVTNRVLTTLFPIFFCVAHGHLSVLLMHDVLNLWSPTLQAYPTFLQWAMTISSYKLAFNVQGYLWCDFIFLSLSECQCIVQCRIMQILHYN